MVGLQIERIRGDEARVRSMHAVFQYLVDLALKKVMAQFMADAEPLESFALDVLGVIIPKLLPCRRSIPETPPMAQILFPPAEEVGLNG